MQLHLPYNSVITGFFKDIAKIVFFNVIKKKERVIGFEHFHI